MTPPIYPYERLRLTCGCHEVVTAAGCTDVFTCEYHASYFNGAEALLMARAAIATYNIVSVVDRAGVINSPVCTRCGRSMKTQDQQAWDEGYASAAGAANSTDAERRGLACPYPTGSVESWSWYSGFVEGSAARQGYRETDAPGTARHE